MIVISFISLIELVNKIFLRKNYKNKKSSIKTKKHILAPSHLKENQCYFEIHFK